MQNRGRRIRTRKRKRAAAGQGKVPRVRPDGLQLDEKRRFQERWWTTERIAWIAFCCLVIVAATGALGAGGPLATARQQVGGAELEYPRISRWQARDRIHIHFQPGASNRILIMKDILSSFAAEEIQPPPARSRLGSEGLELHFEFEPDAPGLVKLQVRATRLGPVTFQVKVDDSDAVTLNSFILP